MQMGWIDYCKLERIYEDWFQPYQDVVGIDIQGYNSIQENRFLFGAQQGAPGPDLFHLLHEMAHMVEIDAKRCHYTNWGLKYGKEYYFGGQYARTIYEMSSPLAVEREIRVMGIQLILNRHYQIEWDHYGYERRDSEDMSQTLDIIQNYDHFFSPDPRKFDWDQASRFDSSMRGLITRINVEKRILEAYYGWSLNSLRIAWHARMCLLRRKQKAGCWRSYKN